MPRLKNYHWSQIKDWFCPSPGYVLDFSNKTFSDFFEDHFSINIYADAFSGHGTSKFNRLKAFVEISPPHIVVELFNLLWREKNRERDDELEILSLRSQSDVWAIDPEYVSALMDSAAIDDAPFINLINELASLPSHSAAPHLQKISAEWTLDSLDREVRRAQENVEKDPEAAVTAACSMLESVCRSILVSREIDLPKQLDIKTLYKEVREPLGLSPAKAGIDTEVEADVRTILSALGNSIQGIGALRSHSGTAHGRERGFRRLDPRIARLAVNSSFAVALFLIETWEKRFPEDKLTLR
ncbi:abortive infection family protein [Sulfitobacter sp. LCG007]